MTPPPEPDPVSELSRIRAAIGAHNVHAGMSVGRYALGVLGGGAALVLALLGVLLTYLAARDLGPVGLLFVLPLAGVLAGGVAVVRWALRPELDRGRGRSALLEREQELTEQLAQRPTEQGGVPLTRQPGSYAQLMWTRFPLGRSPEQTLRELPADAPTWRVGFHRTIGRGVVGAVGFIVLLIALTAAAVLVVFAVVD